MNKSKNTKFTFGKLISVSDIKHNKPILLKVLVFNFNSKGKQYTSIFRVSSCLSLADKLALLKEGDVVCIESKKSTPYLIERLSFLTHNVQKI